MFELHFAHQLTATETTETNCQTNLGVTDHIMYHDTEFKDNILYFDDD